MVGEFDPESFEPLRFGPGDEDRERALAAIRVLDGSWHPPAAPLALGDMRWRPDLEASKRRLLHLALTGDIAQALIRRMRASRDARWDLTVALGSRRVEISTLSILQDLDARIIAMDWEDEDSEVRSYRSVADWIATERISLAPEDLRALAGSRLDAAVADRTNVKGRFYEETLCLVFSQVPWLTVDEHAYRNASEEIDLVLGIHAVGYVAELAKGAVAIATAKNEAKATGSATVKYLKEQMANRKGRCTLGFLCSATTISGDAKTEILRGSQASDFVLVELDHNDLRGLLKDAQHLDERMQALIRRAIAD